MVCAPSPSTRCRTRSKNDANPTSGASGIDPSGRSGFFPPHARARLNATRKSARKGEAYGVSGRLAMPVLDR